MDDVFAALTFGLHFNPKTLPSFAKLGSKKKSVANDTPAPPPSAITQEEDIFGTDSKRRTQAPPTPVTPTKAVSAMGLSEEEIGALRKRQKIHVTGTDVPAPISTFDECHARYHLPEALRRVLAAQRFVEPTPIQMQAIPVFMQERELLAIAPTGSGKTAAFLIPIIAKLERHSTDGARALILVPTRELAEQSFRVARSLREGTGIHVALLSRASMGSMAASEVPKTDILVSTPERVATLIEKQPECLKKSVTLRFIVFDEADKLFEPPFLEQVDKVVAACPPTGLVRALFGATMPSSVEELARSVMTDPVRVSVGARGTPTANVKQRLVFCGTEEGKIIALRRYLMGEEALLPPVVVFVQCKERAEDLYATLRAEKCRVAVIHSGLSHGQREAALRGVRTGEMWVLIATDLVARGLDLRSLNGVINYDFPQSVDEYVHRVGRAGRRREGVALTFFTQEDAPALRSIATAIEQAGCDIEPWMRAMPKMSKSDRRKLKERPPEREAIMHVTHIKVPFKRRMKVLGVRPPQQQRSPHPTAPAGSEEGDADAAALPQADSNTPEGAQDAGDAAASDGSAVEDDAGQEAGAGDDASPAAAMEPAGEDEASAGDAAAAAAARKHERAPRRLPNPVAAAKMKALAAMRGAGTRSRAASNHEEDDEEAGKGGDDEEIASEDDDVGVKSASRPTKRARSSSPGGGRGRGGARGGRGRGMSRGGRRGGGRGGRGGARGGRRGGRRGTDGAARRGRGAMFLTG